MTVLLNLLVILSATNGSISIVLFATVIGAPVKIASVRFGVTFFLTTEIVKKPC